MRIGIAPPLCAGPRLLSPLPLRLRPLPMPVLVLVLVLLTAAVVELICEGVGPRGGEGAGLERADLFLLLDLPPFSLSFSFSFSLCASPVPAAVALDPTLALLPVPPPPPLEPGPKIRSLASRYSSSLSSIVLGGVCVPLVLPVRT